jgi:hypothetical protein
MHTVFELGDLGKLWALALALALMENAEKAMVNYHRLLIDTRVRMNKLAKARRLQLKLCRE